MPSADKWSEHLADLEQIHLAAGRLEGIALMLDLDAAPPNNLAKSLREVAERLRKLASDEDASGEGE